jgi:hypothetical protein
MAETQQRVTEVADAAEATADEMAEHSERLGTHIEDARKRWDDAQRSEGVTSASGDWEDTEPDDSTGEDPSGFDDPESLDEDAEDDDDPVADEE